MSPDFMTVDHFLQVVQEEVDKMVYEEGLLLRDKFCEEIAKRLEQEIKQGPCLTEMPA